MQRLIACSIAWTALCSAMPLAAQVQRDGPERPTASKPQMPQSGLHHASSFAPHAGIKRRVYGAPIQRPILSHVAPKKPK